MDSRMMDEMYETAKQTKYRFFGVNEIFNIGHG